MDISAKRLDPADNLNLLRAPSRVSQPASLPALRAPTTTFSSCLRLHPQVANNNQNMRSQLPPEERSKRVAIVPQMSSTGWGPGWCWCWGGGSRLMKASEIDGCVCWQHWNCHCATESLSVMCVCVASLCLIVPQRKSFATGMDSSLALSDWALWSDCGSNLCFNFSLKTMHNLQFHC